MKQIIFTSKGKKKGIPTEKVKEVFLSDNSSLDDIKRAVEQATDRLSVTWASVEMKDQAGELIPIEDIIKQQDTLLERNGPITDEHCFDDKTSILTDKGLKLFKELMETDLIVTLNPNTHSLEFQKPTEIQEFEHNGDMVKIDGQVYNQVVTSNHRLFVKNQDKEEYTFLLAEELLKKGVNIYKYRFKRNCKWEGINQDKFILPINSSLKNDFEDYDKTIELRKKGYSPEIIGKRLNINPDKIEGWIYNGSKPWRKEEPLVYDINDWIRFMAWYLSEGYVNEDKKTAHYFVRIPQSLKNQDNREEIVEIIRNMGFKPFKCKEDIAFTSKLLVDYLKQFGHAKDKFIPKDIKSLSQEQLKLFVDTYIKGDGNSSNNRQIYTVSKRLRDDLLEIGLKCGYGVSWGIIKSGYTHNNCFSINFSKIKVEPHIYSGKISKEYYKGKTYCVTVPNGIVMLEREGKMQWSGNSNRIIGQTLDYKVMEHPKTHSLGVLHLDKTFNHNEFDDKIWDEIVGNCDKEDRRLGASVGGFNTSESQTKDEVTGEQAKVLEGFKQFETASVTDPCNPMALTEAFSVVAKSNKGRMVIKPFAGYKDFADCVSQNQDKDNPEAYCGSIQTQVEKIEGDIMKQRDPAAVCGEIWFNGTEEQRGAFSGGTQGRGRDEKMPKEWMDDCIATIGKVKKSCPNCKFDVDKLDEKESNINKLSNKKNKGDIMEKSKISKIEKALLNVIKVLKEEDGPLEDEMEEEEEAKKKQEDEEKPEEEAKKKQEDEEKPEEETKKKQEDEEKPEEEKKKGKKKEDEDDVNTVDLKKEEARSDIEGEESATDQPESPDVDDVNDADVFKKFEKKMTKKFDTFKADLVKKANTPRPGGDPNFVNKAKEISNLAMDLATRKKTMSWKMIHKKVDELAEEVV